MTVEALPANQPETFYRGAGRIAEFRNVPALPDRPEDWVGSVTSRFALAPSGLSTLADGRVLADAIAADPHWWLGPEHGDEGRTRSGQGPDHDGDGPDRGGEGPDHDGEGPDPDGEGPDSGEGPNRGGVGRHRGGEGPDGGEGPNRGGAGRDRGGEGRGRIDTGVLVKLLDAGQRLPLHVHPDRRFADTHLASPYGKTEAWVIVSARPDAYVHLGFARDVEVGELAGWVAGQKTEEMLAATNRIPVAAGDAILCPAGLPHAIGDGILLVEIQEPTDFSVLLEYENFGLADGHLGLGYDLALQCVDRGTWTPSRLAGLRGAERLLPAAADEFFAARRLRGGDRLEQGFSVLVVVAGEGRLTGEKDDLALQRGDTLLVPYAAGPLRLDGPVEAIRLAAAGA